MNNTEAKPMKKYLIGMLIALSWVNIGFAGEAGELRYENPDIGISFHYPPTLKIDHEKSVKDPLSIAFQYGEPPFAVHILFKEIPGVASLEEFIQEERANQEKAGYRKEVVETSLKIGNNISAVKFVRKSMVGDTHYFVFPSRKSKRLYVFWHTTSKTADPNKKALKAFDEMIKSLKVQ